MSTIASPRPSSGFQSPTSSRSSLSLDRPSQTQTGQRRNRSALRDYYNIKSSPAPDADTQAPTEELSPVSELDRSDFDAAAYASKVLQDEGLENLLKAEAGLVGEIRGLDGERKALVYDNYSKLIAATDTIKRMRTNMDPLAPMTITLEPVLGHIATTAEQLSESSSNKNRAEAGDQNPVELPGQDSVQLVKWVLKSPERLSTLLKEGKKEEAEAHWTEVEKILDKWDGVEGVEDLRQKARTLLAS